MKLSRYTLFVDDYPEPGKSLAYNTRTQGLVVLSRQIRSFLSELPRDLHFYPNETQPILGKLQEMGITAPDEADELDIVRDWFETVRHNSRKLEAYVLTSYFCNFACPYCFEGKVKERQKYLTKEKAVEIIEWMKNKTLEVNPEKVEIVFYGGEPLMNIPVMEFIAEQLYNFYKGTPWKFYFTMVTNGALVSPELIDRLNQWGLEFIRITIDGDKEFHDKYRPFIGGRGTFDVIMRNIKAVADKTMVVLAGNFNEESYPSIYRLLDYLEAEGLKEKLGMIDFKPITERREPIDHETGAIPTYDCDPGHAQKMLEIKKELIRRGFKTSKALSGSGVCHFKSGEHQVIIDTDGLIFKCPAMVGHPEKSCGTVADLKLNERYHEFLSTEIGDMKGKCSDCAYLPFCAGGCNYHAELQTGDYKNVFCERDFFDKTIHEFIKIKYQQLMAAKQTAAGVGRSS